MKWKLNSRRRRMNMTLRLNKKMMEAKIINKLY